jgi:hypothetical protein
LSLGIVATHVGGGRRPHRRLTRRGRLADRSERGAVIVEFALLLPLLAMLLFGMMTGGLVMSRRLAIAQASRESARYGATVAWDQCIPTSVCSGRTWAQQVRELAVHRSDDGATASDICVALVEGPGSAPLPLSLSHTTKPTLAPCFIDDSVDVGKRVQVSITVGDRIEGGIISVPVVLSSEAISKLEQ